LALSTHAFPAYLLSAFSMIFSGVDPILFLCGNLVLSTSLPGYLLTPDLYASRSGSFGGWFIQVVFRRDDIICKHNGAVTGLDPGDHQENRPRKVDAAGRSGPRFVDGKLFRRVRIGAFERINFWVRNLPSVERARSSVLLARSRCFNPPPGPPPRV